MTILRFPPDYAPPDPAEAARIRHRERVARLTARFLITAILLLSTAGFAWVVS